MTLRLTLLALAVSLLAAPSALAQKPGARVDTVITSDSKETMAERSVFPPSQPKVYVFYMMADAPKGTKVKVVWVAENVEGYDANKKFSETQTTSQGGTYWGAFSFSRPDPAWPLGTYRVDILVDGTLAQSARFKIQK